MIETTEAGEDSPAGIYERPKTRWLRVNIVFTVQSKAWTEDAQDDIQGELEAIGGDVDFKTEGTVYSIEFPIRERFS